MAGKHVSSMSRTLQRKIKAHSFEPCRTLADVNFKRNSYNADDCQPPTAPKDCRSDELGLNKSEITARPESQPRISMELVTALFPGPQSGTLGKRPSLCG